MSDQATRPAPTPAKRRKAAVDDSEALGIRERNQRLILKAASQEFAAKGFQAARTEDIAARVGLPKANVYYYFQNKRNLYARVLETLVEPLLQAAALLRAELPPEQALPAYIEARMRVAHEHPHTYKAVLGEMLLGARQLPAPCGERLRQAAQDNLACLRSWMERGLIATADPQHLLLFLWSATQAHTHFGWQASLITGKTRPAEADYRAVAESVSRLVLGALAVDGARGRLRPFPL